MFLYSYFWPDTNNEVKPDEIKKDEEIKSDDEVKPDEIKLAQSPIDFSLGEVKKNEEIEKPKRILVSSLLRCESLKNFTSIKKGFKKLNFLNTWDCKTYGVDSSKVDNVKNYNSIIFGFEKDLNWLINETKIGNCNGGLVGRLNSMADNIHTIDLFIYSPPKFSKILEIDDEKKVLKYYRITFNYEEDNNNMKSISESSLVGLVQGEFTDKVIEYFLRELMNLENEDEEISEIEKNQKFIKIKEIIMLSKK